MPFTSTPVLPQAVTLFGRAAPPLTMRTPSPASRARDTRFGGTFRIAGTVKEKNTPVNTPLRRRVWLLDQLGMTPVASAWSNVVTGDYVFDHIRGGSRYMVISFDHTGLYRAVIADNITAEPRP